MTFESVPPAYSSVNSPLVYVVYDANAIDPTKQNYKYVAEILVNSTIVNTSKAVPNPVNGRGIFDVHQVVREYVIAEQNFVTLGLNNWYVNVVINIREEYNGTIGAVVSNSDTLKVYNHYNARLGLGVFTKLDSYADLILSDRPAKIKVPETCTYFLVPRFNNTATPYTYNFDGATGTITPTADTVSMLNLTGLSSRFEVNYQAYTLEQQCTMYGDYVVTFLNKWGAFESVLFSKVSKTSLSIERKSFQKLPYRVSNTGSVTLASSYINYEQKVNFGTTFKESVKLSTDYLTDEEYQWLFQLVVSPLVYVEILGTTNNGIYPVTITNSNYEFKRVQVDELTNLTIDIEFGYNIKTQFR